MARRSCSEVWRGPDMVFEEDSCRKRQYQSAEYFALIRYFVSKILKHGNFYKLLHSPETIGSRP